ncbi:hypothetical protein PLEOSDRAFT_170896 [Pleurotus ostreatus PC15]|uniref:Nucleoplasmin-like domain-containing protein n=1 Tax=Pleurotus ostreatus (strain PC15) TaxID=1137138 RepID=A0A067N7X1_PLEO1|nr:hypothetical protein PLEOSDRAFT_170896 [Pleurotus ostreatus PC15]
MMNEQFLVEVTSVRSKPHFQPLQTPQLPSILRPHPQYPYVRRLRSWLVISIVLCISARIIIKGSWSLFLNEWSVPPTPFWAHFPTSSSIRRPDTMAFWQQSRDTLGSPNHALRTNGAQILRDLTSRTYDLRRGHFRRWIFSPIHFLRDRWLGFELSQIHLSLPRDAIDNTNDRCWELEGHHGYIAIALSVPVSLSHVSIGRIHQTPLSPERPNFVRVWGLVDKSLSLLSPDSLSPQVFSRTGAIPQEIANRRFVRLADLRSIDDDDLHPVSSLVAGYGINILVFKILSNHGGNFTCIHDLGVYALNEHKDTSKPTSSFTTTTRHSNLNRLNMRLWVLNIPPNSRSDTANFDEPVCVTNLAFGSVIEGKGRCPVDIHIGPDMDAPIICHLGALTPGKVDRFGLDLILDAETDIIFLNHGPSPVCLSGYFMPDTGAQDPNANLSCGTTPTPSRFRGDSVDSVAGALQLPASSLFQTESMDSAVSGGAQTQSRAASPLARRNSILASISSSFHPLEKPTAKGRKRKADVVSDADDKTTALPQKRKPITRSGSATIPSGKPTTATSST